MQKLHALLVTTMLVSCQESTVIIGDLSEPVASTAAPVSTTLSPTNNLVTPTLLPSLNAMGDETWYSDPISVNSLLNPQNSNTWLSTKISFGEMRYFNKNESALVNIVNGSLRISHKSNSTSYLNGESNYTFTTNQNFLVFNTPELSSISLITTSDQYDLDGISIADYLFNHGWIGYWVKEQIDGFYPELRFSEGAKSLEVHAQHYYMNNEVPITKHTVLLNGRAIADVQSMF